MLREFNFLPKDSFSIWFDKKYKKEYYITQLAMCKIKFIKEIDNKFNSLKLIKNYSKIFNGEERIYFSKSDILNPFEENYGMFLINFINADFSSFKSAYLTYFCFYGMGLLTEFCNNIPESLNEIATNPNVSIGICQNCGKYFISYKRFPEKYCRIPYSENEEICKDVGIQATYKKKQKDNPCLDLYRKTYQKKLMYVKRSENENTKHKFDNWKKLAKEKVKEYNTGVISENELIDW